MKRYLMYETEIDVCFKNKNGFSDEMDLKSYLEQKINQQTFTLKPLDKRNEQGNVIELTYDPTQESVYNSFDLHNIFKAGDCGYQYEKCVISSEALLYDIVLDCLFNIRAWLDAKSSFNLKFGDDDLGRIATLLKDDLEMRLNQSAAEDIIADRNEKFIHCCKTMNFIADMTPIDSGNICSASFSKLVHEQMFNYIYLCPKYTSLPLKINYSPNELKKYRLRPLLNPFDAYIYEKTFETQLIFSLSNLVLKLGEINRKEAQIFEKNIASLNVALLGSPLTFCKAEIINKLFDGNREELLAQVFTSNFMRNINLSSYVISKIKVAFSSFFTDQYLELRNTIFVSLLAHYKTKYPGDYLLQMKSDLTNFVMENQFTMDILNKYNTFDDTFAYLDLRNKLHKTYKSLQKQLLGYYKYPDCPFVTAEDVPNAYNKEKPMAKIVKPET